jgi:hypothetical protein
MPSSKEEARAVRVSRGRGPRGKRFAAARDWPWQEAVWYRELFCTLLVQPQLGCMVLAWGTVSGAAGMVDTVVVATALTPLETVAVVSAAAGQHSAHRFVVREGQGGERWRDSGAYALQTSRRVVMRPCLAEARCGAHTRLRGLCGCGGERPGGRAGCGSAPLPAP